MRDRCPDEQSSLPLRQNGGVDDDLDQALAAVGPRLRALRRQRDTTLAELSAATGISVSTLSRLESGERRPTLELLLPLARAHGVTAGRARRRPADRRSAHPPATGLPARHDDAAADPPARRNPGLQADHPEAGSGAEPDLRVHEGYEWLYVLSGRLRLVLGEHDLELAPGEAAEFDTRVPHWFGAAGNQAVEFLSLFGRQGERAHLRAHLKDG